MAAELPLTLRLATSSDSEAIWSLIAGVLKEYGITADQATTDSDLTDVDRHYNQTGGAFMVLLDGTHLVGTVALSRDSDTTCELCRMYLAAEYRGRGLGRRLLETVLQIAAERGFREVRLETATVLKEAIQLYRRAGFTISERAPFGKNCDLVMIKRLACKDA